MENATECRPMILLQLSGKTNQTKKKLFFNEKFRSGQYFGEETLNCEAHKEILLITIPMKTSTM